MTALLEADTETMEFLAWLREDCLYSDVGLIAGDRWVAIWPLAFTHAIVIGDLNDRISVGDRWCYHNYMDAKHALSRWNGAIGTEPDGWHRHPNSGRRRPNGKPELEYIER